MTASGRRCFEVILENISHEVRRKADGYGVLDDETERFHEEAMEDDKRVAPPLRRWHR